MKKNKKWIIILCVIFGVLFTSVLGLTVYHNYKLENAPSSESDLKNLQNSVEMVANDIINLEEFRGDIPEFGVLLVGVDYYFIDNNFIEENEIKVYEFDGALDNGFDVVKNHYVGIKLLDIIKMDDFKDFEKVLFASKVDDEESHYVTYDISAVSDKTFIILSRDGKSISNEETVSLISFDYDYRSSIENLTMISFGKEQVD